MQYVGSVDLSTEGTEGSGAANLSTDGTEGGPLTSWTSTCEKSETGFLAESILDMLLVTRAVLLPETS